MKGNITVGTTCKSDRRPLCVRFSRYLTVLTLLAASMQITDCGGGGPTPQPTPTITAVAVSCSSLSILTNQTASCSAVVTGTGNYSSAVTWTASPAAMGSVNASGK